MSITPLKKVTLCGLRKEKHEVLERLQELGCMHLLPLRPAPTEVEKIASPRAEEAYKALRFLTDAPNKRRQVVRDPDFDVQATIRRALDLKQALRDATDRRDFLENRIDNVEPWGDLNFPPHDALAEYRLWFYVLPVSMQGALQSVELPWQIVHRNSRLIYVVLIAKDEPPGDVLPVPRTHTGALPLVELRAQFDDIEIEIEELAAQRQALTRYIYLLSANLAEAENRAALRYAEQQTRDDDAVVAVQGWVPVDALPELEAYADGAGLACLIEDPAPDDDPPTLLDQPEDLGAGVDLAMFYQVPNYRHWDPTVLLFGSFSIFFAMILADAGYGFVLLLGLLAYWKRLGASPKLRAYRLLGLSLSACTIAYGVMVGSYFGVSPEKGSLLDRLHILNLTDYGTMMKLSIFIGVLHMGFANAVMAYVNRRHPVAFKSLGWIGVLVAGLLIWQSEPETVFQTAGYILIGVGLLTIFLFSSTRPARTPKDFLLRLFDGAKSLTGVMGAFGDVLSYMRLFALGLASSSLALTFNGLAREVHDSAPGIGLLFAILIILFGHVINFGLSIVSGVVHGLRLNFIEFYKWGLPDEGTPFRRFARKEVKP